jgi:hypothetical protein
MALHTVIIQILTKNFKPEIFRKNLPVSTKIKSLKILNKKTNGLA